MSDVSQESSSKKPLDRLMDSNKLSLRKIRCYRNGDAYFKPKTTNVTISKNASFANVLGDLTRVVNLPYGVRRVYTPAGGTELSSIQDLKDGGEYVCASFEKFKPVRYNSIQTSPEWNVGQAANAKLLAQRLAARRLRPLNSDTHKLSSIRSSTSSTPPLNATSRPKVISVVHHTTPPRKKVTILLNPNSQQTYEEILNDIRESLGSKSVTSILTLKGKPVKNFTDFSKGADMFVATDGQTPDPVIMTAIIADHVAKKPSLNSLLAEWKKKQKGNVTITEAAEKPNDGDVESKPKKATFLKSAPAVRNADGHVTDGEAAEINSRAKTAKPARPRAAKEKDSTAKGRARKKSMSKVIKTRKDAEPNASPRANHDSGYENSDLEKNNVSNLEQTTDGLTDETVTNNTEETEINTQNEPAEKTGVPKNKTAIKPGTATVVPKSDTTSKSLNSGAAPKKTGPKKPEITNKKNTLAPNQNITFINDGQVVNVAQTPNPEASLDSLDLKQSGDSEQEAIDSSRDTSSTLTKPSSATPKSPNAAAAEVENTEQEGTEKEIINKDSKEAQNKENKNLQSKDDVQGSITTTNEEDNEDTHYASDFENDEIDDVKAASPIVKDDDDTNSPESKSNEISENNIQVKNVDDDNNDQTSNLQAESITDNVEFSKTEMQKETDDAIEKGKEETTSKNEDEKFMESKKHMVNDKNNDQQVEETQEHLTQMREASADSLDAKNKTISETASIKSQLLDPPALVSQDKDEAVSPSQGDIVDRQAKDDADENKRNSEGALSKQSTDVNANKTNLEPKSIGLHINLPHDVDNVEAITQAFDVKEDIGKGNYAVVKRVIEKSSGKEYALKIIDKHKIKGRKMTVGNEIEIMKRSNHTNIVTLYEDYATKDNIVLIMELVKGGDLFEIVSKQSKFEEKVAAGVIRDLASALQYLHDRNIVHRDMKPENILMQVEEDGTMIPKLADFGLAMEVKESVFTVCGTPTYVAPEILSETGYGLEVDIWALGVITYILLCGFPPFRSKERNQTELFEQIKNGEFEYLEPFWNNVSDGARDLINGLLVVDPKERLTAADVLTHSWIVSPP